MNEVDFDKLAELLGIERMPDETDDKLRQRLLERVRESAKSRPN